MNTDTLIRTIEEQVIALIGVEPDLFLVEVRIKPTHNVKVFIDGDQGVSIDRLVQYNRKLYRILEASGLFPDGDFSLELSSPGLEEPLKLYRQYVKNTGRPVEVITTEGVRTEGTLIGVSESEIELEEHRGKGKKAEVLHHRVPMNSIKTIRVQIKI